MGTALPQIITEDRASGAQFIDGSLKFNSGKNYRLEKTPSIGTRTTFTYSVWVKRHKFGEMVLFGSRQDDSNRTRLLFDAADRMQFFTRLSSNDHNLVAKAKRRDPSNFYHLVWSVDTLQSTASERVKMYVNGELQGTSTANYPDQYEKTFINDDVEHNIGNGQDSGGDEAFFEGSMSQVYFIDGQQLGPENFGFTDPLTNTWRPKKFEHLNSVISTQYSGASTLTWDNSPIGNTYTLSNGNKTATAGGGGSGYPEGDVWSIAIPADSTYAWTLDITNGDNVGGWYFTDSQTESGTHADERGGNSLGMRPGETDAGYYGTFASANGGSNGQSKISMPGASAGPGFARVDFVVYRPASGTGKVWVKNNGESTWVGGGDPSNTSSTASFIIPDGTTYFGFTAYDRSAGDVVATLDGDGSIQQKIGGNSFYLPMDGNSLISQDISGRGNDWTPSNFDGTTSPDKATGAKPILNTSPGGETAQASVFGSRESKTITVTVAAKTGGGNAFYFGGVERDSLATIRGATITFDTTDSTNNSHPFKLSSTNADSSSGTEYTDGVAYYINGSVVNGSDYVSNYSGGSASGFRGIKWTVPHNVSTTYYYCTVHSGMGEGGRLTSTTDESKADQFAWKNVFAAPLNGVPIDVSNHINSGSTTKTITVGGNVTRTTDASIFYGSSNYWDGSADYLLTNSTTELALGTGDYTIELWYNAPNGESGYLLDFRSGTDIYVYLEGNSIRTNLFSAYSVSLGAAYDRWIHLAIVRSSDVATMYVNGIAVESVSSTTDYTSTTAYTFGYRNSQDSYPYQGYLSDIRVYKGVAKYTSNFNPASTNPDILPDTPSGVDYNSKLTKITDGGVIGDGTTSDYLQVSSSGHTDFSIDGDFTVEWFYYRNSVTSTYMWTVGDSNTSTGLELYWGSSGATLKLFTNGSATNITAAGAKGGWSHYAVVRSGSTITVYYDGTSVGTSSNSTTFSGDFTIGGEYYNGAITGGLSGPISNFRYIKGTALYTSNFTPPTRALTNVTNTKLLCCQSPTSAGDAAVGGSTVDWLPTGYTYWTAGMSQNWENSGGTTSNGDDRIATQLPTSGKYYFETIVNNPSTYRVLGFSIGQSGAGSGYTNNIFGFYYNGNPPLFLTKNSSGTSRAASGVSHGASVGTPNWANGDKLMWAWDADNDKIYMGLNGTWYNSGDPAAGTGQIIDTEDLSASSFYFKLGYTADGGSLTLTNVTSGNSGSTTFPEVNGTAAATNFNPFNNDVGTVRGQESGYCTLNPLKKNSNITLSDGNLSATSSGSHGVKYIVLGNTPFKVGGKFYFETQWMGSDYTFGIARDNVSMANDTNLGADANGYGYEGGGAKTFNSGAQAQSFPATTAGDIFGIAVDLSGATGTVQWFKNGVLLNNGTVNAEFTGISLDDPLFPAFCPQTPNFVFPVNFGQKPFKFPPPDGFQPLNAANTRLDTVIARPDQVVGVTTYNAAGGNQIITLGFKPDLIISKSRDFAYSWDWEDIVRGGGFKLISNSSNPSGDYSSNAAIREWRRDGVRCSSNMNATYDGGGSGKSVSYGFVAGNTAIPECGAISFDGNDYLTFASTSAFLEDAGYTIDGWIYLLSAPANSNGEIIFDTGSGGNDPELNVYADGSGNIQLYDSLSNNTNWNGGAPYMNVGQWYYFKQTVDGSSASDASATHKLYIDGQLGVTNTINLSNRSASSAASIAARTDGSVIGHFILSNLRYRDTVDNSTDVPTAPFTGSEANTVLLCCNQPAPADDNADPTDSTITPSTISQTSNPGNANVTIFGRFTKDGVAYPSVAAAGLGGGDLTITGASVGTKNGFSIIRYNGNNSTGQTVKHGLTQKPDFMLVKNITDTSGTYEWMIYHKSKGATYYGLFSTSAFLNNADIWADTEPTDSQFYVSVHNSPAGYSNGPNWQFISYIWHDVPGLQKFGSFTGNGSTDGTYVELGFEPAIIMMQSQGGGTVGGSAASSWCVWDSGRMPGNPAGNPMYLNLNDDEITRGNGTTANTGGDDGNGLGGFLFLDILSNGFKCRTGAAEINDNNQTFVYAAWAASPTVNLYGAGANAH